MEYLETQLWGEVRLWLAESMLQLWATGQQPLTPHSPDTARTRGASLRYSQCLLARVSQRLSDTCEARTLSLGVRQALKHVGGLV